MSQQKKSALVPMLAVAVVALAVGYFTGGGQLPSFSSAGAQASAAHNIEGRPSTAKSAEVTIVEYSDFECPFCSRVNPTLQQVKDEYGSKVNVVFKHFPLGFHKNAQKAGEASECAYDQGKFWEMHDKLFANQKNLSVDELKGYAKELGLDTDKFNTCLDTGVKADIVKQDMADGQKQGVTGTPAFFVNGTAIKGAQPLANFKRIIDTHLSGDEDAIAELNKPAPAPQAPPAPSNDPVEVDGGGNAVLGNPDATVEVIEFSDFECPFCVRAYNNIVKQMKIDYVDTGKVKFIHRDYPLPFHTNAQKMGEAAECAGEQGKYFEFHDLIYDNPQQKTADQLKAHAATLGLDQAAFDTCLDTGAQAQEIKDDFAAGQEAGVRGTPTFYVNGVPVRGAVPYDQLKAVIEEQLAK